MINEEEIENEGNIFFKNLFEKYKN